MQPIPEVFEYQKLLVDRLLAILRHVVAIAYLLRNVIEATRDFARVLGILDQNAVDPISNLVA